MLWRPQDESDQFVLLLSQVKPAELALLAQQQVDWLAKLSLFLLAPLAE